MTARIAQIFIFLAAITVGLASTYPRKRPFSSGDERIVVGEEAESKQFPHQVAMIHPLLGFFCGGSIISDQWVLTAAHCAVVTRVYYLYVGAHNILKPWELGRKLHVATKAIVHENYNSTGLIDNDIAVIKTSSPIQFSEWVSSIALPTDNVADKTLEHQYATISGWGSMNDKGLSLPVLRAATLTVISNEECTDSFHPYLIRDTTLCCQGIGSKSACHGDSGSPLITFIDGKPVQIGVASFVSGHGCEAGFPHAYTRLSKYVPWIQNVTGLEL